MNLRYELVPNRTTGYDCLDDECDRKVAWSIESAGMRYRAFSCRGHLNEVCTVIANKGDTVMQIAKRWG
jgi:hypothetical protein